ncbi:MAG TPA: hypothetical protein PKH16_10050 [Aequorivita sp.]|nr:hypothetical protein [Aequorivita sp.]
MKTQRIKTDTLIFPVRTEQEAKQPFVMICTVEQMINLCINFSQRINTYIDIAQKTGYRYLVPDFDDTQQLLGDIAELLKTGTELTPKIRHTVRREIKETLRMVGNFEC